MARGGNPADFAHEGDFEHVTVRVKAYQFVAMYFAAHDPKKEGGWFSPGQVQFTAQGHPIAYSAKHSHASYPSPGKKDRYIPFPDYTANGGPVWNTELNLVRVTENSPAWMRYSGRWGEIGEMWAVGDVTSGPWGIRYKDTWWGDRGPWEEPVRHQIQFYEDNRFREDRVGTTTDAPGQIILLTERHGWSNDEARSCRLKWVDVGTLITVFDESDANPAKGWAQIEVKQSVKQIDIASFQRNYEDAFVKVTADPRGQLDGKISRIHVDTKYRYKLAPGPLSAARRNSTPDGASTEASLVEVYPNPIGPDQFLTVALTATTGEPGTLTLQSPTGKILSRQPINGPSVRLSTKGLPPGNYLLLIGLSDRRIVKRIIILK